MMTAISSATIVLFSQVTLDCGLMPSAAVADSDTHPASGSVASTGRCVSLVPIEVVGNACSTVLPAFAAPSKVSAYAS